ncbi:hypothetical protein ARC78_09190 [Stenotrophomonas pictorum JCM 9942]|uniref:Uncharacterized protein n=1 Tax=Stenotrophomonas pictorum JCM 9942 TaxID=1236960 RepID=A0A0R0APP5_9GAMM|nr:hypothetical protein [Stenotrophomonas pictorum]KRG42520.1 hypothetical protein ARC78_09190 [Stenotrophomonas pictorum JCM 9942]
MPLPATALILLLVTGAAAAGAAAPLAGRFGHAYTATDGETVWTITPHRDGDYRVQQPGKPEAPAAVLDDSQRIAFWQKMDWDTATAAGANCLHWGEPVADSLRDLFDTPPAAAPVLRRSLLCHLPGPQRAQIGWLADNASDWFYYDALSGVMEITPLP